MHQHKCGFGIGGFRGAMMGEPREGCGHVWAHNEQRPGAPISDDPHFCPSCGLGPWVLKYAPQAATIKGVPYVVPTHVGTDDPEFQHAACEAHNLGVDPALLPTVLREMFPYRTQRG